MKYHLPEALILRQEQTGPNLYLLEIKTPEIAAGAKPGQFVHIRVADRLDPLLRRPFSICGVDRDAGLVRLWYQVVGKGTKLMSGLTAGEALDVLGPLGRGFETELTGKKAGLIGGGMGIAPLLFLGGELAAENSVQAFWGGRDADLLPKPSFMPAFPCQFATEDGSAGRKGFVTELLADWLSEETPDILYACGPRPMLVEVKRLARQHGIPLQVSLEAAMACGVGACLGCTCGKSSPDQETWLKACKDGPVFWEQEVEL